ncbi:MAG: dienelactone hydrolase [Gammaproteobacteria bacterium]|nr:dienelactone hydrolase [Gammaproteobacteria bacterium]
MRRVPVMTTAAMLLLATGVARIAPAEQPPSRPVVDAPELAALGAHAVGVRTLKLVDHDAVDVLAPHRDRVLEVDLWYPAVAERGARPESYSGSLPAELPGPPAAFTIPGLAVRDARPEGGHYPLVIVSHGRSNVTAALSWLTENLASKGYVIAAIRHADLQRTEALEVPEFLLRRPLDIAFVARALQESLAHDGLVDPDRVALIGYSMGGYGVLTDAGAVLDPQGGPCKWVPGGSLLPYAAGGPLQSSLVVTHLRAVVAIAPWGAASGAWGNTGLAAIKAPLLLIAGDRDHTVDYRSGARAIVDAAAGANRYLLTYKGAGHALGLGPAPPSMRGSTWDISWFEDPVWRKDRIIAINLHMITAFLDRYVKDDAGRAAYIDGLVPESDAGSWRAPAGTPFDARSPGSADITLWKGFQRDYAEGLELLHHEAQSSGQGQ